MTFPQIFTLVSTFLLTNILSTARSFSDESYTAAVFEFARRENFSTPDEIIKNSFTYYENAIVAAKSKGADIIIFPEYGIFPYADRETLKNFLEKIPDPKVTRVNPCVDSDLYTNRPILLGLSCMAKNYSIVVVANTGGIEKCQEEEGCPDDGDFLYNTNVAFDSDGSLVGRYYKERLFYEEGMDLPRIQQDPTFSTAFGKFGMFVCFDVVFKKITDTAKHVDAILLPTMWIDPTPLMTSVQYWQAFSFANNVTFMAANMQLPGYSAVGSGIFNAKHGVSAYTYNTDGKSKLVVAEVPRYSYPSESASLDWSIEEITVNGTRIYENDGNMVPEECSRKILNETRDPLTDYRCMEENTVNYTFVQLKRPKDFLEACNNGICCSVDYEVADLKDNFYLGVYNGTYNMLDRYFWCEQNCLLVRCEALGGNPCATFPMKSHTEFKHLVLSANITSDYIYPSVISSGIRLLRNSDWIYNFNESKATITLSGTSELLVAGLNGRCYNDDPMYVR